MSDVELPDWMKEVEKDADTAAIPTEVKMKRLADLAAQQRAKENEIEEAQAKLSQMQIELQELSERFIPELMTEIGISEFKLSNGLKVTVKPFYNGKITDPAAYDWLENNGYAELVKNDIVVSFRRTDTDIAQPVRALLEEIGMDFKEKSGVHYQTLSAWIKERIVNGDIPDKEKFREMFNVFTGYKTKIS